MNDERNNRPDLNDAKLEGMLRDFFRLEMPVELNQPFSRTEAARPLSTVTTLTIVAESTEPAAQPRPRHSMMAVISALAAMVMTAVVVVNWDSPGVSVPQVSKEVPHIQPAEKLMDVSRDANSKSTHVIGEDGVTLEETDGVDLAPRK